MIQLKESLLIGLHDICTIEVEEPGIRKEPRLGVQATGTQVFTQPQLKDKMAQMVNREVEIPLAFH
jgi:hypothetical protein